MRNSFKLENSLALNAKHWVGVRVNNASIGILRDEGPLHVSPPSINFDVIKVDVFASVCNIASNHTWRQNTTMGFDISQSDVLNVNEWLSLAPSEWIGHAAWTTTIWLLLLLWANVDVPPNWEVNLEVLIEDVFDFTSSRSWISFDVDSLNWILEGEVLELNSSDAGMGVSWWHRSDGCAQTVLDSNVFGKDVLGASVLSNLRSCVRWLDSDGVVPACNVDSLDGNITSTWVNAVCVKRHGWPRKNRVTHKTIKHRSEVFDKPTKDLVVKCPWSLVHVSRSLLENVSGDLEVVNIHTVDIVEV